LKYLLLLLTLLALLFAACGAAPVEIVPALELEQQQSPFVPEPQIEPEHQGLESDAPEIADTNITLPNFAKLLITYGNLLPDAIYEISLPLGYIFQPHMNAVGDLAGNGLDDLVIVITEYYDTSDTDGSQHLGRRHLYIMLALPDGGFEFGWHSGDVMMHARSAGRFVDGFTSMEIEDGVLSIEHIWGSAHSAHGIVSYAVRDSELILVREEISAFHSTAGNKYTEIYYPKTGSVEIFTQIRSGESEEERLVLFSHTTTPNRIYEFSRDAHRESVRRGWQDDIEWQHARKLFVWGPLEHMYSSFPFGSRVLGEVNINASQALTMVRNEHFPEFTRVELLLSAEAMESFDIISGYEVPRFFYTDGERILLHGMLSQIEDSDEKLHRIYLREPRETDWGIWLGQVNLIIVYDATGEIAIL